MRQGDDVSGDGLAFWEALGGRPLQLPESDADADAAFEAQVEMNDGVPHGRWVPLMASCVVGGRRRGVAVGWEGGVEGCFS